MSQLDDVLKGLDIGIEQSSGIRFTIVGAYEDRGDVMDRLYDAGASIGRSGPYTDAAMHPKVDVTRFLFTGFLPADTQLAANGEIEELEDLPE